MWRFDANTHASRGVGFTLSTHVSTARIHTHPEGGLHAFNTRVDRTRIIRRHHTPSFIKCMIAYARLDATHSPSVPCTTNIRMFGNLGFGVSVNLDAHVEVDRQIITFVVSIFFLLFFPPPLQFLFFFFLLLLPFFAHVEVARGLGGHVQVLDKGAMDLTVT